jgi:hypothetical protein
VDQVSEFEYDLFIRPDTCNPRFRVWFNFTVENVKESQVREIVDTFHVVLVRTIRICILLGNIKIMTVVQCIFVYQQMTEF